MDINKGALLRKELNDLKVFQEKPKKTSAVWTDQRKEKNQNRMKKKGQFKPTQTIVTHTKEKNSYPQN